MAPDIAYLFEIDVQSVALTSSYTFGAQPLMNRIAFWQSHSYHITSVLCKLVSPRTLPLCRSPPEQSPKAESVGEIERVYFPEMLYELSRRLRHLYPHIIVPDHRPKRLARVSQALFTPSGLWHYRRRSSQHQASLRARLLVDKEGISGDPLEGLPKLIEELPTCIGSPITITLRYPSKTTPDRACPRRFRHHPLAGDVDLLLREYLAPAGITYQRRVTDVLRVHQDLHAHVESLGRSFVRGRLSTVEFARDVNDELNTAIQQVAKIIGPDAYAKAFLANPESDQRRFVIDQYLTSPNFARVVLRPKAGYRKT